MRLNYLSLAFILALQIGLSASSLRAESIDLANATIEDINKAFDAGTLTSEKLVQMYLDRIEAYDKEGPAINAMIYVDPKALEFARELDKERAEKGPRSTIHGIPFILKDLFDAEGQPTTAGFVGLEGSMPWRDGWVAKKLRENGGIILGKTNMNDWFARAPWGASTLGGQTLNPYALEYVPGGSSSGSGAGIAAAFAQVSFGSETGVSIRNPTSENNLVGLAPTLGLVSRTGMIMNALTHERGGPMSRSVYDLAATLEAVAGFDPEDLVTMASRGHVPEGGYVQFVDPESGLQGARIGVLRDMFRSGEIHEEATALIETAIEQIEEAGATVIDPLSTGLPLLSLATNTRVSAWEKKAATDYYLSGLGPNARYKNMTEMIDANPDHLERLRERDQVDDLDFNGPYLSRLKNREMMGEALIRLMDEYQLDALVFPFKTLPASKIADGWSNREGDNALSSQTGFPGLLVPAGFTEENLPIAIEFLGRPFSEPTLIKLASGYEAVSKNRKLPENTPPLKGQTISY
ncbi:amidase family protein [Pelagicoccus sp. SDUM812003]|uniref:amidase family protein n=1 Tax=Pelagicoccus sp. SDUM812003 TaxID=3041267 RepID=UPI00280D4AEB|nr:amidase family protein [Pelagicoccus sp. SDUM812003]MDQ8204683.1 amidase family protein [Pelagicoccus sp. SDUM812003]